MAKAAECNVNDIVAGSDGFVYMCSLKPNGSKYWRKTKILKYAHPRAVGKNTISIGSVRLRAHDDFLPILRKKPKSAKGRAYIFGPMYDDGYYFAGNTRDITIKLSGNVLFTGKMKYSSANIYIHLSQRNKLNGIIIDHGLYM